MKVSKEELVTILANYGGEKIYLRTSSPLKMNKGGRGGVEPNPYIDNDVRKVTCGNYVFTEKSYGEQVNESLDSLGKERVFEAKSLPWGEWEVEGKVIKHKDKLYVRCYIDPFETPAIAYEMDGKELSEDSEEFKVISGYLPKQKETGSKTQEEAGLDKEHQVKPICVDFANIVEIKIGSEKYQIS